MLKFSIPVLIIVVATETIITVIVEILVISLSFHHPFRRMYREKKYLSVYDERSNVLAF